MKKINIKRFGTVLIVFAVIIAMNTVVFAASTISGTYNVSISGITRNEYSYSLGYAKTSSNDYATLDNLTGASTNLGVRFLVKVESGQYTYLCTDTGVYREGVTKLTLDYQVTTRYANSYRIKVIQADYPRVSSATMTTDFTP